MTVHVFPSPPRARAKTAAPASRSSVKTPPKHVHQRAPLPELNTSPLSSLGSTIAGIHADTDVESAASEDELRLRSNAEFQPAEEPVTVDLEDAKIEGEEVEDDYSSDEDAETARARITVNVEVLLRSDKHRGRIAMIASLVRNYLENECDTLATEEEVDSEEWCQVDALNERVQRIRIAESLPKQQVVAMDDADLQIHCYTMESTSAIESFTTALDDDEDDQQVPAATVRDLPSIDLDGLWDNLVYSNDLKARLLQYIRATVHFSSMDVDPDLVSCNRLVLLHGPPGTGKTSLCRALAQKLCIRLSTTFPRGGKLVEINSHSLFSKWYSESGKLVQKLFSQVTDMAADQSQFIVIMIDEVESLTAARTAAMKGNEPGDAVRVVNALLTQLDKLKTRRNVLVLTTSNITEAIDPAFIDRADIKEFVDYPPPQAIYWILTTSLQELVEKEMIKPFDIPGWRDDLLAGLPVGPSRLGHRNGHPTNGHANDKQRRRAEKQEQIARRLRALAVQCSEHTLAGRFLRRLPLLAFSGFLLGRSGGADEELMPRSMSSWVKAMEQATEAEIASRKIMKVMDA